MESLHKKLQRNALRKGLIIGMICLASVSLAAVYWAYFIYPVSCRMEGRTFNRGENGLWLRYFWYAGDSGYWSSRNSMIAHLNSDQIKYAFFHVRQLKPDGHLALKYADRAVKLTNFVHEHAPDKKVVAWISLGNAYPATGIDLSDEKVRRNAILEALWLIEKCGFDGIQWDYEPCKSGDKGFLALLKESRSQLPLGSIISVATPICKQAGEASTWYVWDESYFASVAEQVDQIAVMCYDLVLLLPWQYENAIKRQVPAISTAVAKSGHHCAVIFGLPAYDRNFIHDHCETLRLALKAMREGVDLPGTSSGVISGIALFADYTADESEWKLYRKYWLEKSD